MNLHNISFKDISGNSIEGSSYLGKKVIIVNTASACGYTPQFEQLEELYQLYNAQGFVVIGFPSNDFGAQDPGSNSEIAAFCQKNYGVSFPMMEKVNVLGSSKHPIFQWLEKEAGAEVKWNFEKFLIDENGDFVKRLGSPVLPTDGIVIDWLS